MAYDSEIIAILSTGISFRRFLFPYLMSATVIAILSFLLGAFIIPNANEKRIEFEKQYMGKRYANKEQNIQENAVFALFKNLLLQLRMWDMISPSKISGGIP